MVQLQRNQKQEEELKLLNDLKLQFEKELWALNPELAVIDTILNDHPEIIESERYHRWQRRQQYRPAGHAHGRADRQGSDLQRDEEPDLSGA